MFNTIAAPRVASLRHMGMQHVKAFTSACWQHVISRGAAREVALCLHSPLTRPTHAPAACAPSSCPDRKNPPLLPPGSMHNARYRRACADLLPAYRKGRRPGQDPRSWAPPVLGATRPRLARPFVYACTSLPFWIKRKKITRQKT